jgi:hypothetical protein
LQLKNKSSPVGAEENKVSLKPKDFQIVVELNGDSPEDFQRVTDVEMLLERELRSGKVDGNDVGQGIVNLFIITKDPAQCFRETMSHLKSTPLKPTAAGYRGLDEEDYVRLWPTRDTTPFELK